MAIFGFKKQKENVKEKKGVTEKAAKTASVKKDNNVNIPRASINEVIVSPRITEKSGVLSQGGVYTFEISKDANKISVAKAVASIYKVKPVKVAIINIPAKKIFHRGRKGIVSGFRKAIVTLKKGDKIDFV